MKKKNLIQNISTSIIIAFIIASNIYIQIKTPITYSGGCTKKEYEGIRYLIENIEENSFVFTDLRLSAVLRSETDLIAVQAPGSASSSSFEINVTYNAFYSNDSFKAYYSIKALISYYYPYLDINIFYVYFSKLFVIEGVSTLDFSLGPIPLESYEMYLNSTFFRILFQNAECFVVEAN